MGFSAMAKVLTGVGVVGGAIATPFVLKNVNFSTHHKKSYLETNFEGCTKLLEEQPKRKDDSQIYLCPLKEKNKLEMIYFEIKDGNKNATKIKELDQVINGRSQPDLIVKFEDGSKRSLDWPGLLFDYTISDSSSTTVLNPEEKCVMTPDEEKLFKCDSPRWQVIKPNPKHKR